MLRLNNADVLGQRDALEAVEESTGAVREHVSGRGARRTNSAVEGEVDVVCRDQNTVSGAVREIVVIDTVAVVAEGE